MRMTASTGEPEWRGGRVLGSSRHVSLIAQICRCETLRLTHSRLTQQPNACKHPSLLEILEEGFIAMYVIKKQQRS